MKTDKNSVKVYGSPSLLSAIGQAILLISEHGAEEIASQCGGEACVRSSSMGMTKMIQEGRNCSTVLFRETRLFVGFRITVSQRIGCFLT